MNYWSINQSSQYPLLYCRIIQMAWKANKKVLWKPFKLAYTPTLQNILYICKRIIANAIIWHGSCCIHIVLNTTQHITLFWSLYTTLCYCNATFFHPSHCIRSGKRLKM